MGSASAASLGPAVPAPPGGSSGNATLSVTVSDSPQAGSAPLTVSFSASASGGTAPYSFGWTFGDGTTGTGASASHVYTSAGTYTAIATVTDAVGATASSSTVIMVQAPGTLTVYVNSSVNPAQVGQNVPFTADAYGGTGVYSYAWSFGDGTYGYSNASTQNHTYSSSGSYAATVSVSDSSGNVGSAVMTEVVNGAMLATLSAAPNPLILGQTVDLHVNTTGGVSPYSYTWSGLPSGCSSADTSAISCTPTSVGSFSVTVVVSDSSGNSATATASIRVLSPGSFVVTLAASPSSGAAPLTTVIAATVSGGTAPYNCTWNLGNGETGWGCFTATVTYVSSGSYVATVLVTDAANQSVIASVVINVGASTFAVVATATPSTGIAPLTVNLTAVASGGTAPYTYSWQCFTGAGNITGSGPSWTPTFASAGTYYAFVTAQDAIGQQAQASVMIVVASPGTTLQVTVSANPSSGYAPLATTLTAYASGGSAPYVYAWNLGDGSSATGASVSHTYQNAGTYNATVQVTDAAGQVVVGSVWISAWGGCGGGSCGNNTNGSGSPLLLSVSVSPAMGPAPLTTTLAATVSGGTAPYQFTWNFGDGSSATGAKVTHTYAVGSYDASVYVMDANGNVAYTSVLITATGSGGWNGTPALTILVSSSGISGKAPFSALFSPTVIGGTAPYTLAWNFGDGSAALIEHGTSAVRHEYTSAGQFVVTVQVTDSAGKVASWSSAKSGLPSVDITPTTGPKTGGSSTSGLVEVAVLAALGFVIVVLAVMAMRRKNRGLLPPSSTTAPAVPGNMAPYDRYSAMEPPAGPPTPAAPPPSGPVLPSLGPENGNGNGHSGNGMSPPRDALGDMV